MQAPAVPGETAPAGDGSAAVVRHGDGTRTPGNETSRATGVLVRLRSATAPAHERVEARLFPSSLVDLASYRRMLAVLLTLHEPLEQAFTTEPGFADLGIDLVERRKVSSLRRDLAGLDAQLAVPAPRPAPASSATGPAVPPTPLTSLPAALGAFYVLEGSTLGGRFLLPEVQTRLGDVPTAFLTGYGARTGRMWKQTRAALVRGVAEAPHPPSAEQALVAGADATFTRLDALLDSVGWAGGTGTAGRAGA